jgi:predicted nucleotidyltransferase
MVEPLRDKLYDLAMLCRRLGVRRLELIGSATGKARRPFDPQRSDYDFLVTFGPPPEGMGVADQYFSLLEGLEEVVDRPFDLLDDQAIRNPYLRETVDEQRSPLFDSEQEPDLVHSSS